MLRVRQSTDLESLLDRAARLRLRDWRRRDPNYRNRIATRLASRPAGVSLAEYLRFLILHRQFGGSGIPGLSHAVRLSRQMVRSARHVIRISQTSWKPKQEKP